LDYALAIRRNRDQLKDIVLALFALARMRVGGSLFTLPRSTFAAILAVLRPAESAVRRLIVIAAHRLSIPAYARRDWRGRGGGREQSEPLKTTRAFKLFDPLKSFDTEAIWDTQPTWQSGFDLSKSIVLRDALPDHQSIDAIHLGQRLNALFLALNDIPRQARRLKKWEQKRDALLKACRPTRITPMRPGLPPGWRKRNMHEIDPLLKECHRLAMDLLNAPDTS
jgi:hypothetical protein